MKYGLYIRLMKEKEDSKIILIKLRQQKHRTISFASLQTFWLLLYSFLRTVFLVQVYLFYMPINQT